MLANVNLSKDLEMLGKNGRVVVIGSRGTVEIDPRNLMAGDAQVLGMTLFNSDDSDLRAIHAGLAAGLSNSTLKPVIGKEFLLESNVLKGSLDYYGQGCIRENRFGTIVMVRDERVWARVHASMKTRHKEGWAVSFIIKNLKNCAKIAYFCT